VRLKRRDELVSSLISQMAGVASLRPKQVVGRDKLFPPFVQGAFDAAKRERCLVFRETSCRLKFVR
jgi:hypothetical protein